MANTNAVQFSTPRRLQAQTWAAQIYSLRDGFGVRPITSRQLQQIQHSEHVVAQKQECFTIQRRTALQMALVAFVSPLQLIQQPRSAFAEGLVAATQQVLHVGPDQQHKTITAAVQAADPGAVVLIEAGRYNESLVITKSLKLAPAQQGTFVEVYLDTQQPYQHCLEIPAGLDADADSNASQESVTVKVEGLQFRHYSKSVANNYCIFLQSGVLLLKQCDISSSSGVGVGVEGAHVVIDSCDIHDCSRHGVAVFGSLEGAVGVCDISNSSITFNKLNGILVRDGGAVSVRGCSISSNGEYGVHLQGCKASLTSNKIVNNRGGSVALQSESVEMDMQQLQLENDLDQPVGQL